MRAALLIVLVALLPAPLSARADQASPATEQQVPEVAEAMGGTPLYFALEIRHAGRLVAQPRLLGETGKLLKAERRRPGAAVPDYQLVVNPSELSPGRFHLALDLAVPGGRGRSELDMDHGEVRKLKLGPRSGRLEVSLTLMMVDSPEFRALMRLMEREAGQADEPSSI
jgi:hypothetical protein